MCDHYDINKIRELLIFSIAEFDVGSARPEARADAEAVIEALKRRHFKCPEENQHIGRITLQNARNAVDRFSVNERLNDHDMVAICIMTHG